MAYDETAYRRDTDEVPSGPAAYRAGVASAESRHRRADLTDTAGTRITEPFDTGRLPAWDGRDRLGVHIGWEIVLLLAVAALAFLLYNQDSAALRRPALDGLLITGAAVGLLAMGAGLT